MSLDALDVTLDLIHGDLVGLVDGVPDTEIGSVLCDNDVRVGNPRDELAVVQETLLALILDVVDVELFPLVTEEELVATWVELKVVDFGVMLDGGLNLVNTQVLDADGLQISQVGDDLGWFSTSQVLLRVVKSGGDHVRVDVLGAAGTNDLVDAVLDD